MRRLLPLLLLCACAGSLVDHAGVTNPPPDSGGGGLPPTQQCIDTCTTAIQGATPSCNGDTCTYVCNPGLLRTPLTQSCSVPSAIAAGGDHTCAIASGQVLCWGNNGVKELGVEGVTSTGTPVQVPDLPSAADQITASTTQTCVHLVSPEAVWCWGAGQAPHPIAGIPGGINAIAAGAAHACAATASGVWCWGDNASGQLGVAGPGSATAVQAANVPGSKVLAAGTNHTCAGDLAGSQLWCWGANDAGQNGTGSTSATSLPAVVQSQGASGFYAAAGEGHTCSITSTGSLSCWGANGSHQVDGSTTAAITSPKGELSGASAAAGGAGHTCALQGGALSCWGLNDKGQLDTGDFVSKTNPTRTSLANVGRIAAGSHHTCALLLDASLKCWGANDVGQLGSGTISGSSTTPVDVTGR